MILSFLLDLPLEDPLLLVEKLRARLAGAWTTFDLVQVRAKHASAADYVRALRMVREAVREDRKARGAARAGRPLLLANDRVDVALAAGAEGVHVGAEDLSPEAIRTMDLPQGFVIGLTCHTAAELRAAPGRGADYVGLGSFFPSRTKPGTLPDPRSALRSLPPAFPLPLYAIGGITPENLDEVLAEEIDGIVVSGAIQSAPDAAAVAGAFRARLDGIERGSR